MPSDRVSVLRLLRRRFGVPRGAATVIVVLAAMTALLISAAPRMLVQVTRDEVAHQVGQLAPTTRDLTGTVSAVVPEGGLAGLESSLSSARDQWPSSIQGLVEDGEVAVYTDPLRASPEVLGPTSPFADVQLMAEPDALAHLQIAEGTWPRAWSGSGPIEIALSADAAATMDWPIGERRTIPTAAAPLEVVLTATVRATDPDDPRWLHLPTVLTASVFDDGNRRPVAGSAAWIDPGTWETLDPPGTVIVWYPVDTVGAADIDVAQLLPAIRAIVASPLPLSEGGDLRVSLDSGLVAALGVAVGRTEATRAILAVAAVGPVVVAFSLEVLAAALMVRRRRQQLALLAARGAAPSQLRRLLALEGALLGVPASVIAAALGVLLVPADAGWVPVVLAILAGVVPAAALALALPRNLLAVGREDLGHGRGTLPLLATEALVVVLAAVAVTVLLVRGAGPGALDPLAVAAPLLLTVALALVVVRLHPIPLTLALRLQRRRRGATGLVGAARAVREPVAGTAAVLAMLVAVAIAVFSSVVLATVDRGAVVAAQRTVGADIQISGPYVDADRLEAIRGIEGIAAVAGLLRGDYLPATGPGGRVTAEVIATDVTALAAVQNGMVGAFPAGVADAEVPMQVVPSTAVTADLGGAVTAVSGVSAVGAPSIAEILGLTASSEFVVVGAEDYTTLTGKGFFPRTILLDLAPGYDAAPVVDQVGQILGGTFSVSLLDASTDEIRSSPAVTALRIALLSAVGIAIGLSAVAVLVVAGVTRDARSRVIALLRTMGMGRRATRGIVAWEFVPLGVTALVAGGALGILLPLLIVFSIDLRPFTGGGGQPSLFIDPVLSATLVAIVLAALALAVIGGVLTARATSTATVLRTGED
ncbi:FtsX-like permease family protein [Microbacterium schleiferi]|uniref:FtsX-like permease family protein n=1 Tax=Microbacterium schleiferi TaxID=69362 RepID=A0ABU7V938_9MICO